MNDSEFDELRKANHEVSARVDLLAREMAVNTEATQRVESSTRELVEVFLALKGGIQVLGWIGKIGQYLLLMGLPGALLLASWGHIKVWFINGGRP